MNRGAHQIVASRNRGLKITTSISPMKPRPAIVAMVTWAPAAELSPPISSMPIGVSPMAVAINDSDPIAQNWSVAVTGSFRGLAHFGDQEIKSAGEDLFVSKLAAADGQFVWSEASSGSNGEWGLAIDLDSADNVYIAGSFFKNSKLGAFTLRNQDSKGYTTDALIAKLDSTGEFVWAKALGSKPDAGAMLTTGRDYGLGIVAGQDGVYATGCFMDTATLGSLSVTSNGDYDAFVAKLDFDGTPNWIKTFGGPAADQSEDISVGPDGNVYSAGDFAATVDFDPSPTGVSERTSVGETDGYLVQLDGSGSFQDVWTMGGERNDTAIAVAVDAAGNVVTAGMTYRFLPASFPTGDVLDGGGFVLKFSSGSTPGNNRPVAFDDDGYSTAEDGIKGHGTVVAGCAS